MLLGGLAGGNLLGLGCCAIAFLVVGREAGGGALLGLAVVVLFFSIGQAIEVVALELPGITGLSVVLASYAVRVLGIGAMLNWILSDESRQLSPVWLGIGVVATVIGWVAGVVLVASRQRVPVFDHDYHPPPGWEDGQ